MLTLSFLASISNAVHKSSLNQKAQPDLINGKVSCQQSLCVKCYINIPVHHKHVKEMNHSIILLQNGYLQLSPLGLQ